MNQSPGAESGLRSEILDMLCSRNPTPAHRIGVDMQRSPVIPVHWYPLKQVILANQVTDDGVNLGPPVWPRKKIVVAALARSEVALVARGNACAQALCSLGLAAAGHVVQLTLDREQRGGTNILRTH